MQAGHPLLWSNLTWREIELASPSLVLFPIGATEQHGPHLGTGVDFVLAEKVCHAASAQTGVMVLPTLPYGCSLGHSHFWPGTLSLQPETLVEIIVQVIDWAYRAGVRRFFLINGHVTNFAPLRCALEKIRSRYEEAMIAVHNLGTLSPRIQSEFSADAQDWHANAAETGLIMRYAPELHREEERLGADDPDRTAELVFSHPVNHTSRNGVTGRPSLASAQQGEVLFQKLVEDLCALIEKAKTEIPPLLQPYHPAL